MKLETFTVIVIPFAAFVIGIHLGQVLELHHVLDILQQLQ